MAFKNPIYFYDVWCLFIQEFSYQYLYDQQDIFLMDFGFIVGNPSNPDGMGSMSPPKNSLL